MVDADVEVGVVADGRGQCMLRRRLRNQACFQRMALDPLALGLAERAKALSAKARPEQAQAVGAAFACLTEAGEAGMGELFKVLAVSHRDLPPLPGFDLHRLPEQG